MENMEIKKYTRYIYTEPKNTNGQQKRRDGAAILHFKRAAVINIY